MSKTYATTKEIWKRYWELKKKGVERSTEEDNEFMNLILLMDLFFPRKEDEFY